MSESPFTISEVESLRAELAIARAEARTDVATGLGNRRRFNETVSEWTDEQSPFAVIVFDMANLKPANAALGHMGADELLAEAASHIRTGRDVGVRLGGDEFAVLIQWATIDEALVVRDRIEEAFGFHHIAKGVSCFLAGGVSRWTPDGASIKEMMTAADFASEDRKTRIKINRGEATNRQEALGKVGFDA